MYIFWAPLPGKEKPCELQPKANNILQARPGHDKMVSEAFLLRGLLGIKACRGARAQSGQYLTELDQHVTYLLPHLFFAHSRCLYPVPRGKKAPKDKRLRFHH